MGSGYSSDSVSDSDSDSDNEFIEHIAYIPVNDNIILV